MSDETTERKAEEKTAENAKVTTTDEPDGIIANENATSEMKTI